MGNLPTLDHIALTVPDLAAQVARLQDTFGMVVHSQFDRFALVSDPVTGLKLELSQSEDAEVHFRHFGFQTNDVDATHQSLVDEGMTSSESPHRRDFAAMYTSFLKDKGGVEVQLVKYDSSK